MISLVDLMLGGRRGFISAYLLRDRGCVVVDPGPRAGVEVVAHAVRRLCGDALEGIILTHIHLDHAGGAGALQRLFPRSRIYVHPRGVPHLIDPGKLWRGSLRVLGEVALFYGEPEPALSVVEVGDGEALEVGGMEFRFIHTPGHASHHVAVRWGDTLFTGDAAGMFLFGHHVPTTPPRFELDAALKSLGKMRLERFSRVALPHFGFIEDGGRFVEEYSDILRGWASIVEEVYCGGGGVEDAYLAVKQKYGYVSLMESEAPTYMRGSAYRSVLGIYDYFSRTGCGGEGHGR